MAFTSRSRRDSSSAIRWRRSSSFLLCLVGLSPLSASGGCNLCCSAPSLPTKRGGRSSLGSNAGDHLPHIAGLLANVRFPPIPAIGEVSAFDQSRDEACN